MKTLPRARGATSRKGQRNTTPSQELAAVTAAAEEMGLEDLLLVALAAGLVVLGGHHVQPVRRRRGADAR